MLLLVLCCILSDGEIIKKNTETIFSPKKEQNASRDAC